MDLSIHFNNLEKCYLCFNISLPIMGVLTEKYVYDILWNFPTLGYQVHMIGKLHIHYIY